MRRAVLVEASHRCALPRCLQPNPEIAHIDPWTKVLEHRFENLIALCPNDHSRYDRGEIDRQSMLQYKANLSVLSHRYGELERRVLHKFEGAPAGAVIQLPGGLDLLVDFLLRDRLVEKLPSISLIAYGDLPPVEQNLALRLTDAGARFVARWLAGETLDESP
jgi:hypothetical protein